MQTLQRLSQGLVSGELRARTLVEEALERIVAPAGEGARAFITVAAASARARADEIDRRRSTGETLPPFAGIPASLKDLFDIAGEVTRAGSRVLANQPAAAADAPTVARLRAAGFIFMGRTNMTEFAFSGLGLNPHYGTPLNPFDRTSARIPGGSTSGGAVAVADGMAHASLGTDTGGSCRIPAAFTGLVGFKPTAQRVPRAGAIPLSETLDSVGPIARSVQCCATLDAILRGARPYTLSEIQLTNLRLLVPTTLVLSDMDQDVAKAFERAISGLMSAGAIVESRPLEPLMRIPQINGTGGFAAAEAYRWHRELLEKHSDQYDPRVAARILKGSTISDSDLRHLHTQRAAVITDSEQSTRDFDAWVMPTVPIIPPPLSAFEEDAEYARLNALVLRNPSLANFLDRCSISLPVHQPGEPPVGLMLIGRHDDDERLLLVARAIERTLR